MSEDKKQKSARSDLLLAAVDQIGYEIGKAFYAGIKKMADKARARGVK